MSEYRSNSGNARKQARLMIGRALIQIGDLAVATAKVKFGSKEYPPASHRGQYPAKRTGHLADEGVTYEPSTAREAGEELGIRVGYTEDADYGAILEAYRGRRGISAVLHSLRNKVTQLKKKVWG